MSQRPTPNAPADRRAARRIPPLVFVVIAILLAWFIVATLQKGATHRTPQGGTMPEAAQGTAVIPLAPAGPGAPATPGGTINGPNAGGGNGAAP